MNNFVTVFNFAIFSHILFPLSQEIHRVKYIELQTRRAELRDLKADVEFSRRELIPLTTG